MNEMIISNDSVCIKFMSGILNRPLAKVLFLTILDFDIYLKIKAYH